MSSPVLGVNFGTHDAAAAIVDDGRVLAAAEEERFSRRKHTKAFPAGAIEFCLRQVGLDANDLEAVALFVDPRRQLLLPVANQYYGFPAALGSLASDLDKYRQRHRLAGTIAGSELISPRTRLVPVPHHRAHAASAYLTSPFDEALVVTIDGRGEYETACIFDARERRLIRRHSIVYPHSIGYLYSMMTRYLGFRPQCDEYKVMGLAAHGSPGMESALWRLARFDARRGRFRLDLRYFDHHARPSGSRQLYSPALTELLGPARQPGDAITDRHRDIAHALQRLTEELVCAYVDYGRRLVPSQNLCMAGGVAFNSVANAAVMSRGWFDNVFIQPAAGDAGTSIGAALLASGPQTERHILTDAFLGPRAAEVDIKIALKDLSSERLTQVDDPYEVAAGLLAEGKIIGWFEGRMEFGPRALGSRSILAPATDPGMLDRVNAMIKRREAFRPLAPAVLAAVADDYFHLESAGAHVYPFMLATARARNRARQLVPAVVHVDGSARVQTVSRAGNPGLARLLEAYRRRSGISVLLNTSFNGADEPIVCTPADAVRTFHSCGLHALVLENHLIRPAR